MWKHAAHTQAHTHTLGPRETASMWVDWAEGVVRRNAQGGFVNCDIARWCGMIGCIINEMSGCGELSGIS